MIWDFHSNSLDDESEFPFRRWYQDRNNKLLLGYWNEILSINGDYWDIYNDWIYELDDEGDDDEKIQSFNI